MAEQTSSRTMEDDRPTESEQSISSSKDLEKEKKLEERKDRLLRAVNSSRLNTMEEKVAWLLNSFPKTRDSDITLQIRYWQNFQRDLYDGSGISIRKYYQLARLTSLTRARAVIQNQLRLFQASSDVKRRRQQLEEGERANATRQRPNCHQLAIFIDEGGKTQEHLVVGSMWYLNSAESLKIYQLVDRWKHASGMQSELHFQSINESKLPRYTELADLIAENSAMISFKAVTVERFGISKIHDALLRMTSHLITRGIEHENRSRRAPLPRGISVTKDAEELAGR